MDYPILQINKVINANLAFGLFSKYKPELCAKMTPQGAQLCTTLPQKVHNSVQHHTTRCTTLYNTTPQGAQHCTTPHHKVHKTVQHHTTRCTRLYNT